MLPGISTQVFYPHRLTPTHLDALAGSGADVIELFSARFHFDSGDRQQQREIAAWFRSNPARATLHAPLTADTTFSRHAAPSLNLVAREKPRRLEAMEEIKRALDAAEHIVIASCVLHLGLDNDPWSDYALEHAITAIEHLKAFAAPLGVKLLLENLRNEIATPGHLLDILRIGHFDGCDVCLDVGHLNLGDGSLAKLFELVRPRMAELHLHDNSGFAGGKGDEHLWPATGTERPAKLPTGSINWAELYALAETLPSTIPGILEIHDLQADSPAMVTRLAGEVFSHQAKLLEPTR